MAMGMGMGSIGPDNSDKKVPQNKTPAPESAPPRETSGAVGAGKDETKSFMSYVRQTLFNSEFFDARGSMVSNSTGRIKHMLLQFDSYYFRNRKHIENVLEAYKVLINEMEPDTKFTILTADEADAVRIKKFIEENIKPVNPDRIEIKIANKPISIWARDLIISVLNDEKQPEAVLPSSERSEYNSGQKAVRNAGLQYNYSPLIIEGGNIQKDKDGNIWIGYDSIKYSARKLFKQMKADRELQDYFKRFWKKHIGKDMPENFAFCENEIIKILEEKIIPEMIKRQFNLGKDKELHIIGKDNPETTEVKEGQPAFHIDMAVTPLGDKTVIIGDPELAINIIQNNRTQCLADEEKIWIVDDLIKRNSRPELKRNFDATVKEFESKGYKVIRVPYLQGEIPGEYVRGTIPFITYNNCIMEEYTNDKGEKIKKVYLPQYGISALDDYACDTFEKLGYKVVKVPSMAPISTKQGSIHCLVNDLERSWE